ncbi:dihydrolipoamide acetyltransferase family protein [Pacificibacter sp.]|uniref:dihydrolipoamide acetyltransferase family protein n=1 Tax=Pacificibacter sp. TaxID=1917866 RepID=UPI00321B5703
MGIYEINLPDIGEGIAEAEIDEWMVKVGDIVAEDDVLCSVMTDKAVVEVPTSAAGTVTWIACEAGEKLAIGAVLVKLDVLGDGDPSEPDTENSVKAQTPTVDVKDKPVPTPAPAPVPQATKLAARAAKRPLNSGEKPLAPPSVRKRALDAGIDLRMVQGTGPAERITHEDLNNFIAAGPVTRATGVGPKVGGTDIKIKGMRRIIAEKMALSKARIPHISIVEGIDVTDLEVLRGKLNAAHAETRGKLTMLPFVMAAVVKAVAEQSEINATYDDEAGIVHQSNAVNIGIAAQTDSGLTVPVVMHAEAGSLWANAAELSRLSSAARNGTVSRDELSGSTITISSLGPLGAIATTPIINHPEVAIVGVNKMAMRPMWDGSAFQPRKMMNISCSFDHRVIDGMDAAVFVQKLKSLLETPALLFIPE